MIQSSLTSGVSGVYQPSKGYVVPDIILYIVYPFGRFILEGAGQFCDISQSQTDISQSQTEISQL